MQMTSRLAIQSSSASTVRKIPANINHRRPKSDTTNSKKNPKKHGSHARLENSELTQRILENAQETQTNQVFEIGLSSQKLSDIPDLSQFTKVKILDLSCNAIKKIEGLENLLELKELKLYSNKIEEVKGLEKAKDLQSLHLQHNRIKTIGKGLQFTRKLKTLRLDSNFLSNIDHREVAGCADLTVLDISNNSLTNINAINCLSALQELDASSNKLTTLPDISRCRHLQELDISRNNIKDLSGLSGLVSLMILYIGFNQLKSLTSMGKHRKLQELYVQQNKLSSLTNMKQQFPVLEVLNISNNSISDLDEFFNLRQSHLVEIHITGNPCIGVDNIGYHHVLHKEITSLELVDGVSLKRPTSSSGRPQPLMRPITPSQVLSSRQVEEQLKAAMVEQHSFEESISRRFDTVKSIFNSLPTELPKQLQKEDESDPRPGSTYQSKPPTPCSTSPPQPDSSTSPTRPDSGTSPPRSDSSTSPPQPVSGTSPPRPDSGNFSRPISRCSNRSRIAQAQLFASENFTQEKN